MGMLMNRLLLSLGVLVAVLPLPGAAQDAGVQADVAVSIQQDQQIWAGQQVTINLDLKTNGYSFSNTHFNLPEVSGAFLVQTDTTTVKLNEKINGQTWQVLRYPLALYPQTSGQVKVPPIDVRFTTSEGYGKENKSFEFQTKPLLIPVSLPPGVSEGALLVTTDSFQLDHTWQPQSDTAREGDAFTLTVSRRAKDISAMLLPPLPVFETGGLAAYPQAPEVNDKTERGELTGERTDRIIWVLEKAGSYQIPGIRFQWWDPSSQELKQQVVPGLALDVLASTTKASAAVSSESESGRKLKMLIPVLLAVLIGIILWRLAGKVTREPRKNETTSFSHLKKACENNRAAEAHAAIHAWLAFLWPASDMSSRPPTLNEFARAFGDGQLAVNLEQLQEALVYSKSDWQGGELLSALQDVRRKIIKRKTIQAKTPLAAMNP
jgi:hypothetical protein